MRIKIVALGNKMPQWINQGFQEYYQRLHCQWPIETHWISLNKRNKASSIDKLQTQEGNKMLQAIPDNAHVIALDQSGKTWSTEKLAQQCDYWQSIGEKITFLIGGPEGLAPQCLKRAHQIWSLSELTLPHPLVRVILVEQLYRAWSILNNHPYHK